MRRPTSRTLLLVSLAACGRGEAARTAISDTTSAPRVQPGSVAGAVGLELWQLRPGVTLGEWKNAHPEEAVSGTDTSAVLRYVGDWCAAVQRRVQIGARVLTRTAFFYPPPPTDLALPDSVPDLVRGCVLGLVWVSVVPPDSAGAVAMADSIRTQLADLYGPALTSPVNFWGSAYWSGGGRFHKGDVTAVSALRETPGAGGPDSTGARRMVFAFAFLPSSRVSVDAPVVRVYSPPDTFALDSAAQLAALDSTLWVPLRDLLHALDTARTIRTPFPDSLVRPLRRWVAASAGLPVPRRAAALYVADATLERALCGFMRCDDKAGDGLAPLREIGAAFVWSELGGSWVYQRNWLEQARALDRDSPLGQRILLAVMNAGFDMSGLCAGGEEGFRRVIANGEHYLARVPDSPIAAEVHFDVAEAYRDIVALAGGAGDIYADSSRYSAEAPGAAAKALEHYRAALGAGSAAPTARAAWERAWWLRAGLPLRDVRFYCVYD
jgi:hypothetical protein